MFLLFKISVKQAGEVVHAYSHNTWEAEQEDHGKFEVSLVSIAGSRPVRANSKTMSPNTINKLKQKQKPNKQRNSEAKQILTLRKRESKKVDFLISQNGHFRYTESRQEKLQTEKEPP